MCTKGDMSISVVELTRGISGYLIQPIRSIDRSSATPPEFRIYTVCLKTVKTVIELKDWSLAVWVAWTSPTTMISLAVVKQPGRRHSLLPFTFLVLPQFQSLSREELPRSSDGELTRKNLHTARATRAASASMEIVL